MRATCWTEAWLVLVCIALAAAATADWDECLVITSDYGTFGYLGAMQRHSPWQVRTDLEEVHQDAVARFHRGLYFIINRGAARNIQVVDPDLDYQTVQQFSVGPANNPRDIAFRSDGIAFISCYDSALLLKVDVKNEVVLAGYPTGLFADADGLPETSWMLATDDRLYINCERLDRNNWWVPAGGSCLLVFDMWQEAWIDANPATPQIDPILLSGQNPSCQLELSADGGFLRAGCTGWYGALDGGIDVVDLAILTSLGFEVTEQDLGGDLLDFEMVDDCRTFVIVSDPAFQTSIRVYDHCTQQLQIVHQASGYVHADICFEGRDYVYACDRTPGAGGIRIFAVDTGAQLTTQPIAVGLAPVLVALPVEESLVGVPDRRSDALTLDPPWPNPCNPLAWIRLRGSADDILSLQIFDLRGRRIRSDRVALDGNGEALYAFDGRDDAGRRVPSGGYRVTIADGSRQASRLLTIIR
jgi:hypothetical protein